MTFALANFSSVTQHSQAKITVHSFMALAAMLTIVTILMGIRLCRLRHLNMPVTDGRNSLVKHYLVFTIGYILRSINDYFVM
mmetsp:Transcript_11494/g.15512  ORF Transcript_11494/g.15512 Transcript_11494/m.15512 type:complete len:82 (+) Transcript_11494:552-797(+)